MTAIKVSRADQGREEGVGSRTGWAVEKCVGFAFDGVGDTRGGIDTTTGEQIDISGGEKHVGE